MTAAARLGDTIEHSSSFEGLVGGAVLGGLVGLAAGAAIVFTGGVAAGPMIAAVAATGVGIGALGSVGQVLGGLNAFSSGTGTIVTGASGVTINGQPAARAQQDFVQCSKSDHGRNPIAAGSTGVFINGAPAARVGDATSCGASIASGASGVTIGGGTQALVEVDPEVPVWLENTIAVIGLAGATVLFGPVVTAAGVGGGAGAGYAGYYAGGEIWGEGSDAQALSGLAGSMLGGGMASRAGVGLAARAVPNPTSTPGAWARNGLLGRRSLETRTTNGVPLRGDAARTTTVIGNFRKDTGPIINEVGNVKTEHFGHRPGDFQLLNVPDHLFRNGPQFWREYNEPWLQSAVQRGDRIIVATPPKFGAGTDLLRVTDTGRSQISGFGREYLYLRKHGYVYDASRGVMTKP